MKPFHAPLLAAAIASCVCLPALAQENAPMVQKPSPTQQNGPDGTKPENSGNTGWTGGTGGSFIGTDQTGTPSSPNQQPPVASGLDLKGPSVQNPANRTPE